MQVRFKKLHPNAVIPKYSKPGDAGLDLVATTRVLDGDQWVYGTGLAVEVPEGYVGYVFPRSSIYKSGLSLTNAVGVVDSGYRGEVKARFYDTGSGKAYEVGDRVCQLVIMPYPHIEPVEATELSETVRGVNGWGSSGR
jgi:dUTP pyrophosphatase